MPLKLRLNIILRRIIENRGEKMKYMIAIKFPQRSGFISVAVLDINDDAKELQEKYIKLYGKENVIIVEI